MNWRLLFTEAIASLKFYRRRTVVTILSLAWGVASFVILMSYGDGFQLALVTSFQAVGQDLVMTNGSRLYLYSGMSNGVSDCGGRLARLDIRDV